MSTGYTYEDHPCCDCAVALRAWRYRGAYSHIGGEGPHATLLPNGTYICNSCQRERVRTIGLLSCMDAVVNGSS